MKKTSIVLGIGLILIQSAIVLANSESDQFISDYKNRKKTILEEVLNFTEMGLSAAKSGYGETSGITDGTPFYVWVSGYKGLNKCILKKFKNLDNNLNWNLTEINSVDLREVNETAFRFKPKINGYGEIYFEIGDGKFSIFSEALPLDRLEKAWRIAFQECPGKKTSF